MKNAGSSIPTCGTSAPRRRTVRSDRRSRWTVLAYSRRDVAIRGSARAPPFSSPPRATVLPKCDCGERGRGRRQRLTLPHAGGNVERRRGPLRRIASHRPRALWQVALRRMSSGVEKSRSPLRWKISVTTPTSCGASAPAPSPASARAALSALILRTSSRALRTAASSLLSPPGRPQNLPSHSMELGRGRRARRGSDRGGVSASGRPGKGQALLRRATAVLPHCRGASIAALAFTGRQRRPNQRRVRGSGVKLAARGPESRSP